MSMPSTDERLSAYIDGDLTAEEVAAIEHELAHDADLRADLDALRLVVDTFRSEGPMRAPLGFHAAVMDRIEAEHPEVPWWQQFLRRPFGIPAQGWGVVLAAAAVLVVVQVGRDDGSEGTAETDDPVWRDVPEAVDQAPAAVKLRKEGDGDAPGKLEAAPEPAAEPALPAAKPSPRPKAPPLSKEQLAAEEKTKAEEAARTAAEEQARKTEKMRKEGSDTGKQPVLRTPPTGLTLLTREPAALREVLALVARYGGTVTTPSGGPVTHATLEQAEESVVVNIPSAQLAAFQVALESLGSVRAAFDNERLYSGETLQVPLTFKLVGGSAGTGEDKPNAPAKQRRAMENDMMEAPDSHER